MRHQHQPRCCSGRGTAPPSLLWTPPSSPQPAIGFEEDPSTGPSRLVALGKDCRGSRAGALHRGMLPGIYKIKRYLLALSKVRPQRSFTLRSCVNSRRKKFRADLEGKGRKGPERGCTKRIQELYKGL